MKLRHISLGLAVLSLFPAVASLQSVPNGFGFPPVPEEKGGHVSRAERRKMLDRYPRTPTVPPAIRLPVLAFGFSVPGDSYLLRRESLVSLDFLDEDRLLFTFHVSGLMERGQASSRQRIRALVLSLHDQKVLAEAEWFVPDRQRYLWMLNDGHFLLRREEGLSQGGPDLKLTPLPSLEGQLLWIQMDPRQQFLITNSLAPRAAGQSLADPGAAAAPGEGTPNRADKTGPEQDLVVRTFKRASLELVGTRRVPWTSQTADWPMNFDGYLERVHEGSDHWLLRLTSYTGGGKDLGRFDSTCLPRYTYISDRELLIDRCDPNTGLRLMAMSTGGKPLWETKNAPNAMWPLPVTSRGGLRAAREILVLRRPADRYKRLLGAKDIEGQMVRVFESSNGKILLEAPLAPVLDGGGNVALSPSGEQVAVLNGGAIEVFHLPAPAPRPAVTE